MERDATVMVKTWMEKTKRSAAWLPAGLLMVMGVLDAVAFNSFGGAAPGWLLALGALAALPLALSLRAGRRRQLAWGRALSALADGEAAEAQPSVHVMRHGRGLQSGRCPHRRARGRPGACGGWTAGRDGSAAGPVRDGQQLWQR
nr:hypothetical protein [Thiohalobacter thiocyanaticus]